MNQPPSHAPDRAATPLSQEGAKDPILQPLTVRHLTLKNRIFDTSHAIRLTEDNLPKERYRLYHEEKAKGGIGLTMFGGSSNVSPDSGSVFGAVTLDRDEAIPHLRDFAEAMHRHGSAVMVQLTHLGGRSHWRAGDWLPTLAPSRFREPAHRGFAKAAEHHDLDRIVKEFGDAAWRCREAGLDGAELHVHHHLVGQFWSPLMNHRTDEYGGSIENRARFGLRVLEEMRKRAGDDFLISIRMAVGEGPDAGMSDADYLEMARLHERSGLIDFFNLTYGRIDTPIGLSSYMPGMAMGLAPQLQFVAAFKNFVGLPVFHAARINDLATARYAISEGLIDMVGMTRAHIADPHIVKKISEGREEQIRPCVGATYCSWHATCIHNASIGREKTLPHLVPKAPKARRVTVVGAGPAGLEAARVCAERGHDVTLLEAAPKAGGQVLLAAELHKRRDLIGIIDWRVSEAERLGVTIRYNCFADESMIRETNADVVIIATGGLPDQMESEIPGAEMAETLWDVLGTPGPIEGDVLRSDVTGTASGLNAATTMAERGGTVLTVTPDSMVGMETSGIERPLMMRDYYASGAQALTDHKLIGIERRYNHLVATVENIFSGARSERSTNRVVIENGTIPVDEVYHALAPGADNGGAFDMRAMVEGAEGTGGPVVPPDNDSYLLYRIGDAVASRDIHVAILEATRLARTV
ncbi:MAG: FAD-dependent oxidoreductase [Roseovarius indicus]